MTVILTKSIDLSVAANLAFTGMAVAMTNAAYPDLPLALLIVMAIGIGAFLGAINGYLVWALRIPPIVVTLGTLTIYRGMAFVLSGGGWVNAHQMAPSFLNVPRLPVLGLPILSWIALLIVLGAWFVLTRLPFGRAAYASGGNPTAAVYAGIDIGWTRFIAFVVSGALAGLSGYLWVSRYAVAYVDIAAGFEPGYGGRLRHRRHLDCRRHRLGWRRRARRAFPRRHQECASRHRHLAIRADGDLRHSHRARRRLQRPRRTQGRPHHPARPRRERGIRMSDVASVKRVIPDRLGSRTSRILASWEVLLFGVAVLIFVFNSLASPYFLNAWNLSDATFNFTEKAMIAFAMALLVIAGEIDLSVAAIIALASTAMGAAAQAGIGTPGLVAIGIGTGLLCGAFNGLLVAGLKLPSIVVTIGTMSLFRGISYIVLGDQAYGKYPATFAYFGQGYVVWVLSFEFVLFIALAAAFAILLHATNFGRQVYVIGNNEFAARFSGIPVERVKFILFLLTGLMAGVASVCLTSRLGSTRPSIAQGWELEVVTMVVLGGVSILGGAGTIAGVVIAAFVMGLVTFGLGLLNVPGIVMSIFVGLLLIITIAIPIIARRIKEMS